MTDGEILRSGLERLGVTAPDAPERLEQYAREIRLWNGKIDLVADKEALIVRHLLDSLAILPLLRERGLLPAPRLADVGSGAGLPGVPLALALPDARVILVERSGRRAGFLRSTVAILGLHNAEVLHGDLRSTEVGSVDLCLFRALTGMNAHLVQDLRRTVGSGVGSGADSGAVIAYAGRRSSAEETADQLRSGFARVEVVPVAVPFLDAERHVVVATQS